MNKQNLYDYISKHPYVKINELQSFFDIEEHLVRELIKELTQTGSIIEEQGAYFLPELVNLIQAKIVLVRANFAFAEVKDASDDIRLEGDELNGAFLGDLVFLKRQQKSYFVERVYQRAHQKVVGEIIIENGKRYLNVQGLALKTVRFLLSDYQIGQEGEIIVGLIQEYGPALVQVRFLRSLWMKNAPGVDITKIILENGAPIDFDDAVMDATQSLPIELSTDDLKDRLDLREKLIVTIDGEDAQDFDDAISIEKSGGNYILGVHIADVSHYVQESSPIDIAAQERGTSIYVTDRVVPMLPFALSNGLCSLRPDEDRLTFSCIMTISKHGEVIDYAIKKSVIKSSARLTYTYFQKVIDANKGENAVDFLLLEALHLARKIRKKRIERGSLDLDLPELKIDVDAEGYPLALIQKQGIEAEKVIEDFMILANETVASAIAERKLPFIYRIHEKPDPDRLDNLNLLLIKLGYKPEINSHKITSRDLQLFLDTHQNNGDATVIRERTLQSLARARYDIKNVGHFGLASKCYTHFTSPIRRYPDLLVHRALKRYLIDDQLAFDVEYQKHLKLLSADASEKERRAVLIERACNDMKTAEYMSRFLGQQFNGYIDGFLNSGMFVTLENGVSGLVRFDSMLGYYYLERNQLAIRNKRTNEQYIIGQPVSVIVISSNKETGNVDLQLVGNNRKKAEKTYHKFKRTNGKRDAKKVVKKEKRPRK
ncbi:MAG: ribonuclease R [Bacilli bacterium]